MNKRILKIKIITFLLMISVFYMNSQESVKYNAVPLKFGVIGLSHSHVHGILGRPKSNDIEIVGIVEVNKDLAKRYADQYEFSMNIVFNTIDEMIKATKPEAVAAFGSIYDHLKVVQVCASLGIHVMVEKPLAVSLEHAKEMRSLAIKYNIHLLTNYETTWYATNQKTYNMVQKGLIGDLRKIVVHDGHKGPIEIGIPKEFEEWLTDPITNGAGALMDFGCYGANLITWLNHGIKPEYVTAITQTIKPEIYPKVDDEATIVLQYPKMQAIIQASWNWPISRKDMEVYGKNGYIFSENQSEMRYRLSEKDEEKYEKLKKLTSPFDDPFAYFAALIKDEITFQSFDLSSLENNMIVMEILDAAIKSSKTGKTVKLN